MFADDFSGWKASRSSLIIEKELQIFLNEIREWTSRWRMKLNERKTVYNVFCKKRKISELNLQYDQKKLNRDPHPKFLGVQMNSKLSFSAYLAHMKEKCRQRTNMLKRLSTLGGGINTKLSISIYKALVQPVIDYCPFITVSQNKSALKKTEKIQNMALRVASRWPFGRSNKDMLVALRNSKIEPVYDRHLKISQKYLSKATETNPIIKEEVESYVLAKGVIDGYFNHNRRDKKDTVLAKILEIDHDTNF